MPCKLEIRKTIDKNVADKTQDDFWGFTEKQARKIAVDLNSLWGNIATIAQTTAQGGWRIMTSRIDDAVNREFDKQKKAEESFERDLDFFNGDRALYEQENKEQRDEFFQLDKKKLPPAQEKLDNQLLKFLNQFGVTTKEIEDFKKRFGVDALGATDVMQKLIYLSSRRNITTMPEEAAHMMVMLMGKNSPLIKEAFTNIESWSGYNAVKKQYMPIYKDEYKVKIEALGHLIRDAIVNKYTSENPVEKSLFEKIKDLIENFFKGIRNKFDVKKNDGIVYDKQAVIKIAEGMLSGDTSLVTSQRSFRYSTNVDYYKALEKEPLSKAIVERYTHSLPFLLTGSLAIAKQTNIERWHGEQIHDLDFKVPQDWMDKNGDEAFDKLMDKPNIIKLREIRNELSRYYTKSYLQAPEGYRIELKTSKINSFSPMLDINVYDEKGNKLTVLESIDAVKTLDFFIGGREGTGFENVASWQDIFDGKLSLSSLGETEVMFDRAKDQTDYINVNPVNIQESKLRNLYFQLPTETKEGVEELFDSNPELANQVYEALGFKTKTSENKITGNIKETLSFPGNYNNIDEGLIGRRVYEETIDGNIYKFEISNYSYENEDGAYQSFYDIDFTVNGSEELIGSGFFNKSERAKQIIQALLSVNYGNDTVRFIVEESNKGKQRLALYKRLMSQLGYSSSSEMEYALFYDIKTNKVNLTPQQKQQAQQQYSAYLDSIFPDSKVKDIVYHGTPNMEIESFLSPEKKGYKKQETTTTGVAGIYFSNKKEVADLYQDFKKEGVKGKTYPAVINSKRPLIVGDKATDGFNEGTFGASALWNIQKGVLQGLRKAGIDAIKTGEYASKTSAVGENIEIAVFEPEQIHILGSKQDVQGFKNHVAEEKKGMLQLEGTESSTASPKTIATIKDFLKRIGVDIKPLQEIVVDGVKQGANGAALIMQKLVQVVEGKEAEALTEEAMHFAVEIIQQTDPKLFQQLLKEINNYALLQQVIDDYSGNKGYQTKDGKPDILKLKKEAIAKVLTEVIINKNEGLTEKPQLLAKAQTWWQTILTSLKNLFVKSGFDTAAMKVLSGEAIGTAEDIRAEEDMVYLQKTTQDRVFDKIKEVESKIEKRDGGYYVDGKKVPRRVSDLVKDWYERRFASKELSKSEFQKSIDDLKAEKGTAGHADIEYAFSLFVDKDGYLRDVPLNDDGYVSELNPDNREMYEILKKNLQERLNSFPKGTRFLSEVAVYDAKRGLGGTIDFLAITPDAKVSILDWKFMDLNTDKYEDVPWYKISAWQKQMEQYKLIIKDVYNVRPQDFEQTRMIPIKAVYSPENVKQKILPKLLSIKIGDVNVKNITEDYLIPVGLEGEKTGNKKIDNLLEKLNAIYKKLSDKKVLPSEKLNKAEQLNELFKAIRQLQMKQNINPLIYQAKVLNNQLNDLIKQYKEKYEGKDATSFTPEEISDFSESIETALGALDSYTNLDLDLKFMFQGILSDEDKKLKEDLRDVADSARDLKDSLKEIDKDFTNDIIGGSEKVEDLSKPEKIIKGLGKWFGSTATLQLKSLEVLYKKANRAFGFAGMDTLNETNRLIELKEKYDTWAKSKGLSAKDYFNVIRKKGKNELIDEFNPEFYSTLKKKILDKDYQWVRDNVDISAYNAFLKEKLEEEYARIDNKPQNMLWPNVPENDEENAKIEARVNKEKLLAARMFDTTTTESLGWLQYDLAKKYPKRESWESNEWKELNKPENTPAREFYEYIKERNEYYQSIGYISAQYARTFLPWVRKGLSEKLIFGGKIGIGEQFLRNISIDENETGFGKINPLTGKPIDTIPIHFTSEIEGDDFSEDLFKTMALYNEFAIKFKYLTEIEAQGRALIRLEKNKRAIATSQFGKTEYKDGVLQYTPDNNENSELVEKMVKAIIYQQKFVESETFDQILGKFGKFGENINTKLGFKLLPENLEGRQLSINKMINTMNNTFQINALGLNVLSSMSNFFGGTSQSLINAGKYFTKTDFVKTEMWLLGNKMGGEDAKKAIAALEYFLPLNENYGKEIAKKLTLNKLNSENIQDFLMVLMRNSDKAVQTANFFSYLKNSVVVNGEVVNAREYIRSTAEFKDMYEGSQEQRTARAAKFEEAVEKLVSENSVFKLGSVVNNQFVIPGIERKSESVIKLRRIVQQINSDAMGSLTPENRRLINMNVYGNSFMIFKNWIPRLVDVRMGNLKYNSASDAYEWGRTRMVYRIISEDLLGMIGNLYNAVSANDKGIEYMRAMYEKKKSDYETDTGKELNMTESEFIDLVRQNIKNQLLDLLIYASLFATFIGLKALPPDDSEDEVVKNQYKFLLKATDKFKDEIGYFYDPTSLTKLVSTGIFPSTGLLDNYRKIVVNFGIEMFALTTGDEELAEKNFVLKYVMKSFPVFSQAQAILPMFYPNITKDLGIKVQSRSGVR